MPLARTIPAVSEAQLMRLGEQIAFVARRGDLVTLVGELGAGKTTLARAVIRALCGNGAEEIPSPTFTLVQTYAGERMAVAHFDLYRLTAASELDELGLDLALRQGMALVEWPERAGGMLPHDRLEIRIEDEGAREDARRVTLSGYGSWADRLDRFLAMRGVIATAGMADEGRSLQYLQGDASVRRYGRLVAGEGPSAVIMDWARQPDGPAIRGGLPYSRIAHLAEDVRPFVAVAGELRQRGVSVPAIYAHNLERGFLVLEDLGSRVFASEMAGAGARQEELWRAATDVLVKVREAPPPEELPVGDETFHRLPRYDRNALGIEIELLVDWYWPMLKGAPPSAAARAEFIEQWTEPFAALEALPATLVLRDYHSPNLLWLPEREGVARVGVIDFQDAMLGPAAYDLVSLLQDARVDVPPEIEADLIDHYCAGVAAMRPGFDRAAFDLAYATLGAQRNTKILGIFARLAKRDGKPHYLRHVPRLWRYLERNLTHPRLAALRSWYDRHLAADVRAGAAG
jgi:tRNA threonylcarbamoyl adenosine modification protein YjeE